MNLACRLFSAHISSGLNYRYAYNNKGLMTSRSESVLNHLEKYNYDNLDRLTQVTSGKIGETGTLQTFFYAGNGNLNMDAQGSYVYGINGNPNNKPHAVIQINNATSCNPSAVTYNFFNQPTEIEEGIYKLNLFYNANQQRSKAVESRNGTIENTRFYVNKYYEKEDRAADSVSFHHYHYIYGDNGVVALNIATSPRIKVFTPNSDTLVIMTDTLQTPNRELLTTDTTYYIHTDHLGSYCVITDKNKNVRQRNYFDPWGNYQKIYRGTSPPPGDPQLEEHPTLNFTLNKVFSTSLS